MEWGGKWLGGMCVVRVRRGDLKEGEGEGGFEGG